MHSQRIPSESEPSSSGNLHRGKACLNCRRRKVRCDGSRPICGQCSSSSGAFKDCEYTDSGRTRTQVLEENVTLLETRIQELETQGHGTNSVTLQNPYKESINHQSGHSPTLPDFWRSSEPLLSPSSPGSSTRISAPTLSPNSSTSLNATGLESEELPAILSQIFIHTFIHHSSELGFFLNTSRFLDAALLPLPIGHHTRPSPALLSAIHLWGVRLSDSTPDVTDEGMYLSRALEHTARGVSIQHPHWILHGIQAEVLLAYYFFHSGRILEGKYHVSIAVSLTIGTGLHRIRSDVERIPSFVIDHGTTESTLPPPRDSIEEGERITAFLTVLILDNCSAVALNFPSNIPYEVLGSQIETPWPLDMAEYELLPQDSESGSTVRNLGAFSVIALHARASALVERAHNLASQYHPITGPQETDLFTARFRSLDEIIDRFQDHLPPIDQFQHVLSCTMRTATVIHTLARVATIQLHKPFSNTIDISRQKSIESATSIVRILQTVNLQDFGYLNPIMGSFWMIAAEVLIDEIRRLRSGLPASTPGPTESPDIDTGLVTSIENLWAAMALFSQDCPLMRDQLQRSQDAYMALNLTE